MRGRRTVGLGGKIGSKRRSRDNFNHGGAMESYYSAGCVLFRIGLDVFVFSFIRLGD